MSVPTVQVLTSSGTYTPPGSVKYISVYIIGGGGGGGGGDTTSQGGGGGPGQVILAYFEPGVYSYTIGAAGAAGAAATPGGAGGATTFNGKTAGGGSAGWTIDMTGAQSSPTPPAGTIRLGMIGGTPGSVEGSSQNGGANLFAKNGRGAYSNLGTAVAGEAAQQFGGGGGGGVGLTAVGGAGSAGACIVTEFY